MLRTKPLLFALIMFAFFECRAQTDIELLLGHERTDVRYADREVVYGFGNRKHKGVVYHALSASMFVYQKYLSQVLFRDCAFQPSCSAYSKELIGDYGLFKGVIFTSDRLMRCTRIGLADKSPSYFDPQTHKHAESTSIYSAKKRERQ